ncbi:hypothetical protein [Aeoliella mucimassa]|uniref:hypothetical protein n=1 Tax=Aeoliella mucimassa TaxID=2527972 RepID=UPI00119EA0B3|nr:hypothetical protein [Aeoliella mucimassa]
MNVVSADSQIGNRTGGVSAVDTVKMGSKQQLFYLYVGLHCVLLVGVIALTQRWCESVPVALSRFWDLSNVFIVVAHSEAALMALWVACGGAMKPWRLLAATAMVCGTEFGLRFTPQAAPLLSHALVSQLLMTAIVLLLIRSLVILLVRARSELGQSRFRGFNLASLLLWISVVCVVLAIARRLPSVAVVIALLEKSEFAIECFTFAVAAAIAAWAALGRQPALLRYALLLITCGMLFAINSPIGNASYWASSWRWQSGLSIYVGYPLLIVIWLMPLRMLGFRLNLEMAIVSSDSL